MWLFTKFGFFSAVEHRDNSNVLIVRARVKRDIEELRKRLPYRPRIKSTPDADYPYRIEVDRLTFSQILAKVVLDDLDYPNFKSAVAKLDPKRADAYHEVWATLIYLEDRSRPVAKKKASRAKYL
jgi:hypothetical protein